MTQLSRVVVLCLIVAGQACAVSADLPTASLDVDELNRVIAEAFQEGHVWAKSPIGVANALFGLKATVWRINEVKRPGNGLYPAYILAFQKSAAELESNRDWFFATARKLETGIWEIVEIAPCTAEQVGVAREKFEQRRAMVFGPGEFDFLSHGPSEFLELLQLNPDRSTMIADLPTGWIRESDLPALVALLDSTAPCSSIMSMWSSYLNNTGSTVGHEAAFLIEGYRKGFYPPSIHSKFGDMDIDEIKKWWKDRPGT